MTFDELEKEIAQYVYSEDSGMLRIAISTIIATRMKLGDPSWLILVGASSSGKSQVLRPLALTDEKFIHRIDDLTENTFLSASQGGKGKEVSLLKRIGALGIIVISDLTVIFSRGGDSKDAILSQFRMIYDGEMIKHAGNTGTEVKWKGSLGMLAGCTPSIYGYFEEVADMGERFLMYRMKAYDIEKAVRTALERKIFGRDLDQIISDKCALYIKECATKAISENLKIAIDPEVHERVLKISMLASLLRTPTHYDKYSKMIQRIPVPEMPMRVALQLSTSIKALMVMHYNDHGDTALSEEEIQTVEWCAYSLANEERRACLRILASIDYGSYASTAVIADKVGLATAVIGISLQHLASIGVLERSGMDGKLSWRIRETDIMETVRRLEKIKGGVVIYDRELVSEEADEDEIQQQSLDTF